MRSSLFREIGLNLQLAIDTDLSKSETVYISSSLKRIMIFLGGESFKAGDKYHKYFSGGNTRYHNFQKAARVPIEKGKKYSFILTSDIETVKPLFDYLEMTLKERECDITFWFQPALNDCTIAYLLNRKLVPASFINEYPSRDSHIEINEHIRPDPITERFTFKNLNVRIVPLNDVVYDMCLNTGFYRLWCCKDLTFVSDFRDSLLLFLKGTKVKSSIGIGEYSSAVARTIPCDENNGRTNLIIVDRAEDLFTPLILQTGFDGCMTEYNDIECNISITQLDNREGGMQIVKLPYSKGKYWEACAKDFISGIKYLNDIFGESKKHVEDLKRKPGINIEELKKISEDHLPEDEYCTLINVAYECLEKDTETFKVLDFVCSGKPISKDEPTKSAMNRGASAFEVFPYLALGCMTGVTEIKNYYDELYANYGSRILPYIMRLKEAGLLEKNDQLEMVEKLGCWGREQETNLHFACYSPLSTRIIESVTSGKHKDLGKIKEKYGIGDADVEPLEGELLIAFMGGCTCSEIARIRSVYGDAKIRILTSTIVSRRRFIREPAYGLGLDGE